MMAWDKFHTEQYVQAMPNVNTIVPGETLLPPFDAVTALNEIRTRMVVEEGVKCEMCDNWYHSKWQGVSKALYIALQEVVSEEEEQSGLHWYRKRCNRACVKLHKSITLISKEQGILKKEW